MGEKLPGFFMDFDHNELNDDEIEDAKNLERKEQEKKKINLKQKKKKDVRGEQYQRTLDDIKESLYFMNTKRNLEE